MSSKIIPATTVILMSLCFNYCANAQTKSITIDEAITIALQNNGTIKADSLEIEGAKSLKKTAHELPKLNLNTQLGQYNSINIDNAFQLSQTIPFPTLFGAKKAFITATIKGKEYQKEISIIELKNQVRTYYYQIQYLQHNKIKLLYLDSVYLEFIRVANLRFKTGDIKKIEISTAETKQGEINLLLQQNEVYLYNAYNSLQLLLNTKEKYSLTITDKFEPLQVSVVLDSTAVAKHPMILALYQNAKIAAQNKKVEKAQGLPDFTLGYNNQSLIGIQTINNQEKYFGAANRFSVVNIGIAIPLTYGATKAKIKALDYQKQALTETAIQQQKLVEVQLQNALQQYQQDVKLYNYYKTQALNNATDIVNAAQLGYKTGEINYVEYLYALQIATDVSLKYLQAIQQINSTVIAINNIINN